MTCFLIARFTVNDAEVTARYSALAAPTMDRHHGKIVHRGALRDILAGTEDYQSAVVATFPDRAHALAWYRSADYQALIPLRDQGVAISIALYEISTP